MEVKCHEENDFGKGGGQQVQCCETVSPIHSENDKNPGGFEDLWENSFALEDELDEIILRIAHIIELEKALEEYEE